MTGSLIAIAIVGMVSGWVTGVSAAAWGALSVPLLILLGVEPLAAISSSLAASVFLSLFGGLTHWRIDRSRIAPLIPLVLGGVGRSPFGKSRESSTPDSSPSGFDWCGSHGRGTRPAPSQEWVGDERRAGR